MRPSPRHATRRSGREMLAEFCQPLNALFHTLTEIGKQLRFVFHKVGDFSYNWARVKNTKHRFSGSYQSMRNSALGGDQPEEDRASVSLPLYTEKPNVVNSALTRGQTHPDLTE